MGSEGKEGVLYACGEWEHGQLGFPFQRSFTIEGEVKAYDMEVGVPTLARMPALPCASSSCSSSFSILP